MPEEDPMHPTERLVQFYKERLREWRSKYASLQRDVEACRVLAEQSATKEEEAVKILAETSALQENLSDLQNCLYKEREHVLRLHSDNDKLKLQKLEDRKKIAYLLQIAGIKEDQLNFEDRARTIMGQSPRKRVRFKDVKNFNKSIEKFKEESQTELLQLKIQALETELEEQTNLLRDEILVLTKDFDLQKKEWEVHKKRLLQQVSCLTCRLRNAQEFKFTEMSTYLEDLDKLRDRDLKIIEDNDKLKRSLAICKQLLGDDFPGEKHRQKELKEYGLKVLREQIEKRDRIVRSYAEQNTALQEHIQKLNTELEREKEMRQKDRQQLMNREEYHKKKLEEERKRRLMDSEGFMADVKLLRSKLQSVERQIRQEQLRKRHQREQKRDC